MKRELIRIASEIHKDAYEDTTDVFQLLDRAKDSIMQLEYNNSKGSASKLSESLGELYTYLGTQSETGLTGIPSGFICIDRVICGWQKTDLIIIAARPGMGKTAFVVALLRNAAIDFGVPVGILSLEMSNAQLTQRMVSTETQIPLKDIRQRRIDREKLEFIIRETSDLASAQIYMEDTPALKVEELKARAWKMKRDFDIQLLVVDYMQLAVADGNNKEEQTSIISAALKAVAKELDIPVIALSQLSRAVETRGGDKRPILSDLRHSGSIEQDADIVMFLYRPSYYGIYHNETYGSTKNIGEVIIAKHRNGDLSTETLKFIGEYTQWTNLDEVTELEDVELPEDDDLPF